MAERELSVSGDELKREKAEQQVMESHCSTV